MPESKLGCYVALSVSSTEMHPDEIATKLGLTPSRRIVMGTPTGEDSPATHPYHLALCPSQLSPFERMEVHIEQMLALLAPVLPSLAAIQDRCKPVIHYTCVVRNEDGWELSPELLTRMGSLGIAFCFALDAHDTEDAA